MASLASDLRDAITAGQIVPVFQPQVDLATQRVVGVEALARWEHPVRGPIAPTVFVPVAVSAGIMHELSQLVLRIACQHLRAWRANGHDIELAVNVSPTELETPTFCATVMDILSGCQVPAASVTLELTETEPLPDTPTAHRSLTDARDAGLRISIDDFGAGLWVFQDVRTVRADELKLDRAVVTAGVRDETVDVVRRAHAFGARVVAEGVETEVDLNIAHALGCDRAQGFYFGPPVPHAQLQQLFL